MSKGPEIEIEVSARAEARSKKSGPAFRAASVIVARARCALMASCPTPAFPWSLLNQWYMAFLLLSLMYSIIRFADNE